MTLPRARIRVCGCLREGVCDAREHPRGRVYNAENKKKNFN